MGSISLGTALVCFALLCLARSSYRANLSAVPAIDAGIWIDVVLSVALGNCLNGAFRSAGTTRDAFVRNLISHN